MEIKSKFDHFNINVTNLERSITFYEKALGLKEHHRKEASDGSFTLVYLTDGSTGFLLELTCLKEHPQAYELGENESHLCFRVAGDYDAIRQYHKENGWVCFENTAMGLYFINDPDDYWIEILPAILCNKRITINYLIHQQREYRRSNDGRYCFQRQEREA